MFEHFHANVCATTHVSFPLQLSAHLSECVNAPSTCSFKRYGCVFQVSIRHSSFPVADIPPWEKVNSVDILKCRLRAFRSVMAPSHQLRTVAEPRAAAVGPTFQAGGVVRLQVDTCAEGELMP